MFFDCMFEENLNVVIIEYFWDVFICDFCFVFVLCFGELILFGLDVVDGSL